MQLKVNQMFRKPWQ